MKKVAIVGSEEKYWTPEQRTKVVTEIGKIFRKETPLEHEIIGKGLYMDWANITLISGGCPDGGVDIWAEIVADALGIEKDIHYASAKQWEDREIPSTLREIYPDGTHSYNTRKIKGYKSRNIEIAEACNVLYCIDPKNRGSKTGGQWTMRYAQKLGKEAYLIRID